MTNSQWNQVEQDLKKIYVPVNLKIDDYKVTLMLEKIADYRLGITVLINNRFLGEWLINDCQERRRFFCPVRRKISSLKDFTWMRKYPKRALKANGIDSDKTFIVHYPWWTSFSRMKTHFIENNNTISLIDKPTRDEIEQRIISIKDGGINESRN